MGKRPLAICCLFFLLVKGILLLINGGEILVPADSVFHQMEEGEMRSQVVVCGRLYRKERTEKNQVLYLKNNVITYEKNSYNESKILVYDDSFHDLSIGQTIHVLGTIQKFDGARNPGNFDRRMYYARQKIYGCVLHAKIQFVGGEEDVIGESLFRLRQSWNQQIMEHMSDEQGPVLSAMLLGLKGEMSEDMRNLYQKNGISHVLSISGLHISFIGLGIYGMLRRMRLRYAYAGSLAIIVLSGYGLMVGFSVSVLRAYLMLLIKMGADVSGRVYDMLTALLLSAVIAVAEEPLRLTDASFLLSYGAVLAILVIVPMLKNIVSPQIFQVKGMRVFTEAGAVSAAIQLFLLPIVLYFYYELPVYSVFLNVLVVPVMSWVLGLGIFGSIGYIIWEPLGKFLFRLVDWLLSLVSEISEIFAAFPWSRFVLGRPQWWKIILYYLVLFLTGYFLAREFSRKKEKIFPIRKLLLSSGVLFSFCLFIPFPNRKLQITMLDVGQGDCIFMCGPLGDTYLIDGGSSDVNDVGRYRIEPFLKSQGVGTLDYVFVSHGDADHCNGILEMVGNQQFGVRIRNLVLPENYAGSEKLTELATAAERAGISVSMFCAGASMEEGGLQVRCLQPKKEDYEWNENAGSMVLQVQFGEFQMLFTGDVEGEGEQRLLENSLLQPCDVLKVSHHGSKNSTSEELLTKLKPMIALVSYGEENSYGHPHKETLERLGNAGSVICETAKWGAIHLETDGKSVTGKGHRRAGSIF